MADSRATIIYDPSAGGGNNSFYDTLNRVYLSSDKAQNLVDQGLGRIVVGKLSEVDVPETTTLDPPQTKLDQTTRTIDPVSEIIYDSESNYWEKFYRTDSDTFLCRKDAQTLVDTGLGKIIVGKIPYIIIKDKNCYFDVIKDMEVSKELALQLISSGVATLKDKNSTEPEEDLFDDALEGSSIPLEARDTSSIPAPATNTQNTTPLCNSIPDTAGSSSGSGSGSIDHSFSNKQSTQRQEKKEESFLEKVAPIAAGVAVAGVAIAGIGFALFGGKDNKKGGRKR